MAHLPLVAQAASACGTQIGEGADNVTADRVGSRSADQAGSPVQETESIAEDWAGERDQSDTKRVQSYFLACLPKRLATSTQNHKAQI